MAIAFTDEDLMYLDKEQDTQLRSFRQAIDALKLKGDTTFCKKCGHLIISHWGMQSFSSVFFVGIGLQR